MHMYYAFDNHVCSFSSMTTYTRVAHGSVVPTYMSRAKLFRNPLIDGPGTTFGW